MSRFRIGNDAQVRAFAFVGAFAAVLAQAADLTDPRYWMAATAAGCTALLALMRAPGQARPPGLPPERGAGRG